MRTVPTTLEDKIAAEMDKGFAFFLSEKLRPHDEAFGFTNIPDRVAEILRSGRAVSRYYNGTGKLVRLGDYGFRK